MYSLFFDNWQRKLVALLSALLVWWLVSSSITETKTIPNVPVRITNLPADKTVVGLLPNRLLSKRVTLTLSGTKNVIEDLEPGDLEVLLDVSAAEGGEWIVHINKKNLVSLNPEVDLAHHVTQVEHSEFGIKLSPVKTAKVPIRVLAQNGDSLEGYEYLDVWPQKLLQTVSGSEEEIYAMKATGLELVLNLNNITQEELDALKPSEEAHNDEVSFLVPDKWKKIRINGTDEEVNDPEGQSLRIDFLRKTVLAAEKEIPVRIFYPLKHSDSINPMTHPLVSGDDTIIERNHINLLSRPLYVRDVSSLFLDIVRDNLEIAVVASPKDDGELLDWSVEVIDPQELEDAYITQVMTSEDEGHIFGALLSKRREQVLRKRFQEYTRRLTLYVSPERPLYLEARLESDAIRVGTHQ